MALVNGYLLYKVTDMSKEYEKIRVEVEESREANEKVLAMLSEIRDEQAKQSRQIGKVSNVAYTKKLNVAHMKETGYSIYTDIGSNSIISVEDMDRIIEYYEAHAAHSTAFKGHGKAFVEAAKETGLNPVYLFAHASCESDFGNSYLASTRHNYYGINAVDNNPGAADVMGDDVSAGIIAGARWIKSNYYDNGYTTLSEMHKAGYASDPEWADNIAALANSAIGVM
jgi:beta-N-acetylglucosaminidase